jgi:hypothetical protein
MKIFSFLVLILAFSKMYAQDSNRAEKKTAPWFVERFSLTAGAFLPVNNTNIQVGLQGGTEGTEIDFEKDLGFSKSLVTFWSNFQWRISRRSRVNLNYYNIPRSSTFTLKHDIVFKNDTFHTGDPIKGFFNTAIYQVSYGYALITKPKYELGLLIGLHVISAEVGIALNKGNINQTKSAELRFAAPLPDVGIWGGYAFSNRFAVNLDLDYLALTIGDFSGRVLAFNLAFSYKLVNKLNLAIGYSGLNFDVDVIKNDGKGQLTWGNNGPALVVTYSFGKKTWGQ